MKKMAALLVAGLLMFGMAGNANANILTFDDVSGFEDEAGIKLVPNGYGNLNWDGVAVANPVAAGLDGTGFSRGIVSGDWVAYNSWDGVTSTTGAFNFTGAYFTSAWDPANTIEAKGYRAGVEIYSNSWAVNDQTPTWITADFKNIDALTLNSTGSHFVMDNFTYTPAPAPAPEPSTYVLMGIGGLLLASLLKKSGTGSDIPV